MAILPRNTQHGLWGKTSESQCNHETKMAAISQTTLSNAFSWMKILDFRLKFHWSLFLRIQLTIFQHWFRQWLGADQATSHYLNRWWLVYWRIYASFGLNELKNGFVSHNFNQRWPNRTYSNHIGWHNSTIINPFNTGNIVKCHYHTVHFIMMLHTALQWQQQNMNQDMKLTAPHTSP